MAVDPTEAKAIIDRYQATMHGPLDVGAAQLSDSPLLAHYTSVEVAEQIIKKEEIVVVASILHE